MVRTVLLVLALTFGGALWADDQSDAGNQLDPNGAADVGGQLDPNG